MPLTFSKKLKKRKLLWCGMNLTFKVAILGLTAGRRRILVLEDFTPRKWLVYPCFLPWLLMVGLSGCSYMGIIIHGLRLDGSYFYTELLLSLILTTRTLISSYKTMPLNILQEQLKRSSISWVWKLFKLVQVPIPPAHMKVRLRSLSPK